MIKKIFFIFFIFFIAIFIFSKNNINENDFILIKAYFPKEIIFNKKHLLRDLTNDMKDYLKDYDNSSDVLLSSQDFIYSEDQLNSINRLEKEFKKNIFEDLDNYFKNEKIIINLIKEEDAGNNDYSYIIEISLLNYAEGEYNLISNVPSKILIQAEFFKKDDEEKLFSFKKAYKQMATIEYPVELLRLKKMTDLLIKDFIKRIKPLL